MHPREETEVSIAEKLLVAGCERQLLEVNILAIGVERLGMESALLCGCDNALQALKCMRQALQVQLKCITRALSEVRINIIFWTAHCTLISEVLNIPLLRSPSRDALADLGPFGRRAEK